MVALDMDRNPEISLAGFLARRARTRSDARLITDAVIGFVVAIASLLAQGPVWYLFTSAGIAFLSYGAWGITDRELAELPAGARGARWLALARIICVITGAAATIMLVLGALGVAIGRVIS